MTRSQKVSKRIFDLFFSIFGLIIFFPVILICIFVARIETRASGLFSQRRVGKQGKSFNVHKIRTMYDEPSMKGVYVTTADDKRITKSGRFFRKLKLDELPQLWNVLIGEMSFVGPRPDVPGYYDSLKGDLRDVLQLRPGITGPATIKYRHEEALLANCQDAEEYNDCVVFPDKVQLNLLYLENWSLSLDVFYILVTLKVLKVPEELNIAPERTI